jgi:5-methylcytosine-specific restriction endonuclease McrA
MAYTAKKTKISPKSTPPKIMKSELKPYALQNLSTAYRDKDLRVNYEYQRGLKWSITQKQGLIDSLFRGYEIPVFYIHLEEKKNTFTEGVEKTAWIVDGQQRLEAIDQYCRNEFTLPDPRKARPGTMLTPVDETNPPTWAGKKFQELDDADRQQLLERKLWVVEITAMKNEVRELFIRLQAGTPLTAQEKRDAWPGEFTEFIIKHAGKPQHTLGGSPKPFFDLFKKQVKKISIDDSAAAHYVDKRADIRKFFAQLAMTVMLRERQELDFVDIQGDSINAFYLKNLDIPKGDAGAERVLNLLDILDQLPNRDKLKEGKSFSFGMALHLALMVDSLNNGDYVTDWRKSIINAFIEFKNDMLKSQQFFKETGESSPYHANFYRLLSGAGSNTAKIIRHRHSFLLSEIYKKIKLIQKDPKRGFDTIEREIIWNRDGGKCQVPTCQRTGQKVSFKDAEIHHIIEHSAGGQTVLQNGILVCPECHDNREVLRGYTSYFQKYIEKKYADEARQFNEPVVVDSDVDVAGDGKQGKLKITINWDELEVEREPETIAAKNDVAAIVEMLRLLIAEFGTPMAEQLQKWPVVRYPLSENPEVDFLNASTQKAYVYKKIPETNLYFCTHSSQADKIKRLNQLFPRLTLPDGSEFPDEGIVISIRTPDGF